MHYNVLIGPRETVPILETGNFLNIFNPVATFSLAGEHFFQQTTWNRTRFSRHVPPTETYRIVQSNSANLLQVRVGGEDDKGCIFYLFSIFGKWII